MPKSSADAQAAAYVEAALSGLLEQARSEKARGAKDALSADLEAHLRDSLERAYRATQSPAEAAPLAPSAAPEAAAGDQIYAEFWPPSGPVKGLFGWQLVIPHDQVEPFLRDAGGISTAIAAGLGVIPEIGALLAGVVKAYVAVMGAAIRAVDKGNGVYLHQSWLVEAAIIASGGLLTGPALLAAFIPTTR